MKGASISTEAREAFRRELGDQDKKPSKSLRPLEFREGTNHTQASVDGGKNWIALGERHPSKVLKAPTVAAVVKQLDECKMRLLDQKREASRSLDPKAWGEEVKALHLIEGAKIYENPNEHGFYAGPILHKDPDARYCVQKIGDKSIAIHDARKFGNERLPEKGDIVRINYRAGLAKVNLIKHQANERGRTI